MDDKFKVFLGLMIAAAVIATTLLWLANAEFNLISLASFGIITVIVGLAAWILWRRATSIKSGLPAEDELSKKIMHKAGYYAFLASIYIVLFVGIFEDLIAKLFGLSALEVHHATGTIILLSAISFMVAYFYLSRKGNVE